MSFVNEQSIAFETVKISSKTEADNLIQELLQFNLHVKMIIYKNEQVFHF